MWIFGLGMIHVNWSFYVGQTWFWVKIVGVVLLTAAHGVAVSMYKKLSSGKMQMNTKTLRLLNEVPFVLTIIVVIFAVVEPFSS
jgi:putative membrane protein